MKKILKILNPEHVLLLIFLFLALWLRLQNILDSSFAFTYDVGRDLLIVKNIIITHKIPLIGQTAGIEGIFYGPWWYYILITPFLISHGDPSFIVLFMAMSGVLTVLLGYVLGKKSDGVFLGIIISSILSFSPFMIRVSSQIWNPNLAPLFLLIFFLIIYKIFKGYNLRFNLWKYFLFLGFVLGLIMDTELVFGVLLFLSISIFLTVQYGNKLRFKEVTCYLIGFILTFSTRIVFELRHNFLITHSIVSSLKNTSSSQIDLSHNFISKLSAFYDLWKATLTGQSDLLAIFYILFVAVILFVNFKKMNNENKLFIKMILITFLIFILSLSFVSRDIWDYYLIGIPVFYIILISFSINSLKKNKLGFGLAIVLVLLINVANLKPTQIIVDFNKSAWEGDASVYRNQLFAIDYIYREAKGQAFNNVVYTPPVHDYTYQYLFSWYGMKKYGYVPSLVKSSLFFLIIEPDLQYPSRLEDWLKVREKDGKIIKEDKLKGGIIVQTRIH